MMFYRYYNVYKKCFSFFLSKDKVSIRRDCLCYHCQIHNKSRSVCQWTGNNWRIFISQPSWQILTQLEIFVPAAVLVGWYAGVSRELVEVGGVAGVVDAGEERRREWPIKESGPVKTLIINTIWPSVFMKLSRNNKYCLTSKPKKLCWKKDLDQKVAVFKSLT